MDFDKNVTNKCLSWSNNVGVLNTIQYMLGDERKNDKGWWSKKECDLLYWSKSFLSSVTLLIHFSKKNNIQYTLRTAFGMTYDEKMNRDIIRTFVKECIDPMLNVWHADVYMRHKDKLPRIDEEAYWKPTTLFSKFSNEQKQLLYSTIEEQPLSNPLNKMEFKFYIIVLILPPAIVDRLSPNSKRLFYLKIGQSEFGGRARIQGAFDIYWDLWLDVTCTVTAAQVCSIHQQFPILADLDPEDKNKLIEKYIQQKYASYNIRDTYSQYKHKRQEEHFEMDVDTVSSLLKHINNEFDTRVSSNPAFLEQNKHYTDLTELPTFV